jgi:hypothetical protein
MIALQAVSVKRKKVCTSLGTRYGHLIFMREFNNEVQRFGNHRGAGNCAPCPQFELVA